MATKNKENILKFELPEIESPEISSSEEMRKKIIDVLLNHQYESHELILLQNVVLITSGHLDDALCALSKSTKALLAERDCLYEAHANTDTGEVTDREGVDALAYYDEIIDGNNCILEKFS